jgi:AraC family transcriptional regulator
VVIDFAMAAPSDALRFRKRLTMGNVTLTQGTFGPTDGVHIGSSQVIAATSEGAACRIDWRSEESDRIRSSIICEGQAHVGHGRIPIWARSDASASFFAFGMDEPFVTRIWQTAFDGGDCAIETSIGLEDPVIDRLSVLGRRELDQGAAGGRLYVEALAVACAVHLLRSYANPRRRPSMYRGGLAPAQLRRVMEYINAHLSEELSLAELAEVAGLSPHHFGEAFKTATGMPPHRYVIEKRVERVRELLRDPERPIVDIAHAVGFSNQSHLTLNFRRLTGLTPAKFRKLIS